MSDLLHTHEALGRWLMPAIRGYYYKNQSLPVRGFPYIEKVLKTHKQGTETLVSI